MKMGPKKGKKAQDEIAAEQEKKMKEREQLIEEQKQFIEYEIQRNEEKIKSDTKQHEARIVQLHNSLNKFAALEDLMLDEELQARHLREWNLYIKEDRLPNPPIVPEMNTYLHKWHINFDSYEMKNIPERTDEVLSLLHILEEFIDYPLEANTRLRENWKEVHTNFCSELQHHFDVATYRLIRFVEDNMELEGLNEYNYNLMAKNFKLYLWTKLPLPKPMIEPNPTAKECVFDNIGVSIMIPAYLTKIDLVVRGLFVNYDHFSTLCHSSIPVPLPEDMKQDMSQRSEYERERMIKIQSEQVNTRLTKLVQLRNALIAQATDLNIQIPEAEQAKTKGKEKGGKGKKGKDNKEEDVKEKARQRREELIQNLMGELNLLDVTQLALPKSGSKDGESDSKKSGGSKASKASRKSGSSKKAGPEKEFFRTLEKLKSIPLNKTCSVLFSEESDIEDALFRETICTGNLPGELNLRKFAIVGGVVRVDIFLLLPQPYQHPEKYLLSLIKLPIGLEEIPDDDFEPPFEKVVEKPVITARKSTLQQISSMLKSLVEVKDEMDAEKKGEEKKSTVAEKKSVAEDRKSKKEKRPTAKSASTAARAVSYARHSKSFERRKSTAEMTEEEKRMFRLTSMIDFEEQETTTTSLYPKVTLKLKTDVVYFETPIVVLWDYDKQYWSYENILHLKAEEKQVTFELKKVGPLALATFRYSNIPFRSWDMRPCLEDQTVQLFMRSNHVNVTFKIKENNVCLASVDKLPKNMRNVLRGITGVYKRPRELVKILRSKGLDVFPDNDAYCFVSCQPKYTILEDHLYHCMAILSGVYNFCWSRWNLLVERRKIVILMREFLDRWHPVPHNTLLVSPSRVGFLDCTEWSADFKEEFIPGTKFYADLNQLMQDRMPLHLQKKVKSLSPTQIETVYEMLCLTKVISYTTTYPENPKIPFVSYQVQPPEEDVKGKGKKGKKGKEKGKKSK